MGMLFLTKGTRRLIRRLNRQFSHPHIDQYRVPANRLWFDFPQTTNPAYLFDVCEHFERNTNSQIRLYPPRHPDHPNLVRKWRYFLSKELLPTNHDAIRAAIDTALLDSKYSFIRFDTVEDTSQKVIATTEAESAPGDPHDTGDAITYMRIVLLTPSTGAPLNPDVYLPPLDWDGSDNGNGGSVTGARKRTGRRRPRGGGRKKD